MNFYKRFIGDYRKKTARLTPLEHGVYGLLLDEFYATEGPLPLDAGELANIVSARTDADKAAIKKVLGRYFTQTEAGWVNPRGLEEMENTRKFSDAQKARIEQRWAGKGSGNTDPYRTDTGAIPKLYRIRIYRASTQMILATAIARLHSQSQNQNQYHSQKKRVFRHAFRRAMTKYSILTRSRPPIRSAAVASDGAWRSNAPTPGSRKARHSRI